MTHGKGFPECAIFGTRGRRLPVRMAIGRVQTRNPRVLDPAGAGAGLIFPPRGCGFGAPKRVGAGAGFDLAPRVPTGPRSGVFSAQYVDIAQPNNENLDI
jgi:hypothetical protein